jgi:hypothetical protein
VDRQAARFISLRAWCKKMCCWLLPRVTSLLSLSWLLVSFFACLATGNVGRATSKQCLACAASRVWNGRGTPCLGVQSKKKKKKSKQASNNLLEVQNQAFARCFFPPTLPCWLACALYVLAFLCREGCLHGGILAKGVFSAGGQRWTPQPASAASALPSAGTSAGSTAGSLFHPPMACL